MRILLLFFFLLLSEILSGQFQFQADCAESIPIDEFIISHNDIEFKIGYGNTHFNEVYLKKEGKFLNIFYTSAILLHAFDKDNNEMLFQKDAIEPGPALENYNENICKEFSLPFEITQNQINSFIQDFENGSLIPSEHTEVFGWPARNNSFFSDFNYTGIEITENKNLAPWVDLNGNGNYDPDQGEYPLIEGERMIWTINSKRRYGNEFKYELQYFYIFPDGERNDFFIRTELTNKSSTMIDLRVGNYLYNAIGCSYDDYFSVNSKHDFVLSYNSDSIDGNISDGSICQDGSPTFQSDHPILMTKLVQASTGSNCAEGTLYSSGSLECTNELKDLQLLLQGKLTENDLISRETIDNCETGENETRYVYDGNPMSPGSYSMARRNQKVISNYLMSSNKVEELGPNETVSTVTAYSIIERPHNKFLNYNAPDILQRSDELCDIYQQTVTSTEEESTKEAELVVYPNPAMDILYIDTGVNEKGRIEILDIYGRKLRSKEFISETMINLDGLKSGTYQIIYSQDNEFKNSHRFIKL